MVICKGAFIHTTERTLHCVDCWDLYLIKHSYARCCLLGFLVTKSWIIEGEKWTDLWHQKGVESRLFWILFVLASIHENILSSTVPMEVTENYQFSLFRKLLKQLLGIINARMKNFWWCFPPPIQVTTSQWASVVPIDYTIRIQHRNNFEDKILPKSLSFFIIFIREIVYDTFHHPWAHWFTRMHTRSNKYSFSFAHVFKVIFGSDS